MTFSFPSLYHRFFTEMRGMKIIDSVLINSIQIKLVRESGKSEFDFFRKSHFEKKFFEIEGRTFGNLWSLSQFEIDSMKSFFIPFFISSIFHGDARNENYWFRIDQLYSNSICLRIWKKWIWKLFQLIRLNFSENLSLRGSFLKFKEEKIGIYQF